MAAVSRRAATEGAVGAGRGCSAEMGKESQNYYGKHGTGALLRHPWGSSRGRGLARGVAKGRSKALHSSESRPPFGPC